MSAEPKSPFPESVPMPDALRTTPSQGRGTSQAEEPGPSLRKCSGVPYDPLAALGADVALAVGKK